ncbi:MAG: hypothetical protein WC718_17490 [Phycisphaerales bacterium]|jgi:hypothetical protein
MQVQLPEAYAAACKLIGEQQVQIHFMAQELDAAAKREAELMAKLDDQGTSQTT